MNPSHGVGIIMAAFTVGGALEAGTHPVALIALVITVGLCAWLAAALWLTWRDTQDQRAHDAIVRRYGREMQQ